MVNNQASEAGPSSAKHTTTIVPPASTEAPSGSHEPVKFDFTMPPAAPTSAKKSKSDGKKAKVVEEAVKCKFCQHEVKDKVCQSTLPTL